MNQISKIESEEKIFIYGLAHPDTGELRYIGKARDMRKRMQSHISESKTRRRPVNCWIASLIKRGQLPEMFEISCVPRDRWTEEESHLIAYFRSVGVNLLNLADGGDQPKTNREQLARNGRAAAKSRDPDVWRLKKLLGDNLRIIKGLGEQRMIDRQLRLIDLVSAMSREKQKRLAIELFTEPSEDERKRRVKKCREAEEAHCAKANAGGACKDGTPNDLQRSVP